MSDQPDTTRIGLPGGLGERHAESYWTIVRRQFMKNRSAVFGLGLVMTFFVIAVFVPFLANGKPYYLRRNGELSFPLFRTLTRSDLTIFLLAGAFCAWFVLRRWLGPIGRRRLPVVLGGIVVVGVPMIWRTCKEYNDRTDYYAMASEPGVSVLFPPVHFSPQDTNLNIKRKAPGVEPGHYLGTDDIGRDVFSRLLWSTRVSLAVGFVAQGLAVIIGVVLGAIAGYFGRRADFVIMRLVEVMMCFPAFFLILTILAFFGRNLWLIMAVIGLVGWTQNARFIRGEFLRLRKMEYAMAAEALGFSWPRIVFRHLLPNGMAPVLVNASFGVAAAILVEGGLSFLGFGVQPPTATWGTMLNDGRVNPMAMPWMIILPGFAIFLAVAAYNLVGEGLRDALDPKLKAA